MGKTHGKDKEYARNRRIDSNKSSEQVDFFWSGEIIVLEANTECTSINLATDGRGFRSNH